MTVRARRFNIVKTGVDNSAFFWARLVGRTNPAGTELTSATMQAVNASDYIEFLLNAAGDTEIDDYTGASGAAGRITITDANANTVGKLIDIINGIGVGMDGSMRRYRAALADFPRLYALTTSDLLDQAAAVNLMLGHRSPGARVFADASALASVNDIWVGIGTENGVIPGSGLVVPDYFEDLPGETATTGFAAGTYGDRTRQKAKQNDDSVFTAKYSVVIEAILTGVDYATSKRIRIWDEDQDPANDTPLHDESPAAAGASSQILDGNAGSPVFVGPPGKRLFVQVSGVGGLTDGSVTVVGRYELGANA